MDLEICRITFGIGLDSFVTNWNAPMPNDVGLICEQMAPSPYADIWSFSMDVASPCAFVAFKEKNQAYH